MSTKNGKSFKVPKIRRQENKDNLRQIDVTSRDCLEIVNVVKRSYLASDYEAAWRLKAAALVENRELEALYRAKKADMKEDGRHSRDLADHYAFIVQRDNTIIPHVVKDGLRCKSIHQNSLGDSKLGIYLWRNADVQLKLAESWKLPSCTLLVFKIVLGKCKALSQQHNDENIEPTPNFDCHIAQIQARPSDSFSVQLIRSQVYLYEYTDDCEPSAKPRQILPYAVLTYEKAENVPSHSLNIKVDSYSKRPTPVTRPPEMDSAKSTAAQAIMNKRDPRLNQEDFKAKPIDGVDAGLCVPRLTLGPRPRDMQASVVSSIIDPDDPRSQLSFLTSPANPTFEEYPYQPSFGPGSEEQSESSKEENEPHEPLTSLPPLKLPEQTNSLLDTRYTDPRFGYVDTSANIILNDPRLNLNNPGFIQNDPRLKQNDPNVTNDPRFKSNDPNLAPNDPRLRLNDPNFASKDPRLRPIDPRLQSVPLDPRLQQMSLDPRRQQRPLDPRLQKQSADPRLNVIDPRVQQSLNLGQNVNFPVAQRIDNSQIDEALKTRKKLTLSDYKKKVNISKPETTLEVTQSPNIVENVQEQNTLACDIKAKMAIQATQENSGNISLMRNSPWISNQSSVESVYNTLSIEQQPIPSVSDTVEDEEDESQGTENDFVEEPDDMAKTLNELSDPDDISQSPKQFEEPIAEKPDADDPMLSDAMQKLVEHSGNVTLFTEALRLLQESAEQFGDQLTDPEFLVKKIAEKIDELSKLETQKLEESNVPSDDIHQIHSPDRIMSPDLSNDSKSDNSVPVKHIPLENVDMDVEKSLECVDMDIDEPESEPESKLDLAMQKTLQELAKLEHSDSAKLHNTRKHSNKSKNKKSKKESSPNLNLLDIPIPPDPPTKAKQEAQTKIQEKSVEIMKDNTGKKAEIKHAMKTPETEYVEDDMKVASILPSFKEKKKPIISINLKMNQKSNLKLKPISPENVLDIFKDDIDMRVRNRPAAKDKNLVKEKDKSGNDKLGFGLTDKDYRTVPVKKAEPSLLSAGTDKETAKSKNKVGTSDSVRLGTDESKVVKVGDEHKVSNTQPVQKKSVAKFVDPFGLGSEDIDHRNIGESDTQKKEVNDFGDIDWRTVSDVPVVADVDMRSTDTSTDNSQCSDLGDFDLRRSHSRSVSPTPSMASNKEKASSFKQPVRKFVDPFGLDEDTDERIITRSNSPLVTENRKVSRTKEIALESSQDSNSGSGALFDAYSVGKSKSDNIGQASNEFGDIDWRQAAAAEMGDVDLRSVPVEKPTYSGILEQTNIAPLTSAPVIISERSLNVDPFQQMNKNLQSMFHSGQGIPQYQTSASSYDIYSTSQSKNTQSYESYTTSKNTVAGESYTTSKNTVAGESYTTSKKTVAGEYRTSNIPDHKYLQNYTTSNSQQKPQQGGFHNIMQNLDFSNLKNILATVKQPSADSSATASEDDRVSKDEDDDKPAFVTGLSSMNNKPSETRKLGSVYNKYQSPIKNTDVPYRQNSDSDKRLVRIPGFDVTPEKEVNEAKNIDTNSDSKKEKTKSPSPEKLGMSKLKDKKFSDIKVSDSLPSTPKDKRVSIGIEEVMTPLPDISYQAAILESMEQSALKVRNDDSFTSEMEESPIQTPKRHRSKSSKSTEDKINRKKRKQDSDEEVFSHKVVKQEHNENKTDDDDDDEESGLVIDLDMMSPVVKNFNEKDSPAVKTKMNVEDIKETSEPVVDLTDDVVESALVIDDEEGDKSDSDDLHIEDTLHTKTKDEMTNMIEKSRKNMIIKLKGETKLVNPKTGKAYSECPKGSAIEVVGQSSSSKEIPAQQIHPVHGVIAVSRDSSATGKASAGETNIVQGQPIQAIGNSGMSSQSIIPNISREDMVVTGNKVYGQVPQRQTNQSTITCSSAPSVFGNAAPVSNNISGINRPIPPVTLIPTINQMQQPAEPLKYIHPFTGQTIAYGRSGQTSAMQPSIASIPRATIPMPDPQPVPPPVPQPVPPPAGLSQTPRHVLIVPGQTGQVTGSSAVRLPFLPTGLDQQRPGLTAQTFGTVPAQQTNKPLHVLPGQHVGQRTISKISPGITESNKTSTDVFDCFRDKFEKREIKKEVTNIPNYEIKPSVSPEISSETKMAYSVKMFLEDIENKAKKELNAQSNARSINTIIKGEQVVKKQNDNAQTIAITSSDLYTKKRPGDEEVNVISAKKIKNEFDTKTKPQSDFGSRILETLTEVKNKLKSPEKSTSTPSPEKPVIKPKVIELQTEVKTTKEEVKKEIAESGASSELEDGEISEDSMSESEEPEKMTTGMQASRLAGASIPVLGSKPGQFNRIPTIGSWQQTAPNVGINVGMNTQPWQISTIGSSKSNVSAYKIGADWADIIQNPETRSLERVKATKIESPSLRGISGESGNDTASLVSKSAASISKSRQKNRAQSQVKTLGEWLKLELEIDNIEPLQNIIPYALDTDLTKIPKQRKRRIRMKVKNAIEQEGTKASSFERKDTVTVEVLLSDQEAAKPINPNYSPEVSNEQTELEMKMLGTSLNFIREKVKHQNSLNNINTGPCQQGGQFGRFLPRSLVGSPEDKKMIVAMTLVDSEMRSHLSRTCYYGYPHRRVPDELLLSTELSGFKSEAEDVFLMLMVPLSAKPYHKLLQLRNYLGDMYEKRQTVRNPTEIAKIDEEIRLSHNQRQAVLRGFTGYLNKKRIQRLQETADKYTMVYDYFRSKTPPTPDSMLRFIRTTQMDLRQHLILAKQYLALEEQKLH